MKSNLFFVSNDYALAKSIATKVANFFDMRTFDSVEMFEFDHAPRKIEEVVKEVGFDYVKDKIKSITKMQLDFIDSVFIANLQFLTLNSALCSKNLIVYINRENKLLTDVEKFNKIELLANDCDVAINAKMLNEDEIFEEVIFQIKKYYHIEA